jgi:uncharacterized protein (PEP-CTERM system associated)
MSIASSKPADHNRGGQAGRNLTEPDLGMSCRAYVLSAALGIVLGAASAAFAQDIPALGGPAPEGPAPVAEGGSFTAPGERKGYTFIPRVDFRETLTDNALGTTFNRSADLISTVNPGFRLSGEGGRTKLTMDYAFGYDKYLNNSSQDGSRHNLLGTGTAELSREFLFIDGQASISQELIDRTGAITATERANNNLTSTQTIRLSPYIKTSFRDLATSEVRYAFGDVTSGSDLGDATRHEFTASLKSGPDFAYFSWGVAANYFLTERSTNTATTFGGTSSSTAQTTLDINLQYVLTRELSVLGSVGYQKVDDNGLQNAPDGATLSLGFEYTPGPRTKIRVLGNHRNNDDFASLQGSYAFDTGVIATISYDESITSGQDQLLNNVSTLSTNQQGQFVNGQNQTPFSPTGSALGLNNLANTSVRRTTATATLSGAIGRSTFAGRILHEEFSSGTGTTDQTSNGISVSYTRELGIFTRLTTSLDYTRSEIGSVPVETDDTYRLSLGFSRDLTPTVSMSLFGTSLQRFSNIDGKGTRENAAILALTKTF